MRLVRIVAVMLLLGFGSGAAFSMTCATLSSSWSSGNSITYQLTTTTTPAGGFSACQYIISTGSDYQQITAPIAALQVQVAQLSQVYPSLSVSDGLAIGGAILLVWAIAFSFRALVRLFQPEKE